MSIFFMLLFLVSIVCFVIGLIRPKTFSFILIFGGKPTRGHVSLVLGITTIELVSKITATS